MQSYTEIPETQTIVSSRALLLNNDKTALSNSSGPAFPTANLEVGMLCYRTDESKLYLMKNAAPTWTQIAEQSSVDVKLDITAFNSFKTSALKNLGIAKNMDLNTLVETGVWDYQHGNGANTNEPNGVGYGVMTVINSGAFITQTIYEDGNDGRVYSRCWYSPWPPGVWRQQITSPLNAQWWTTVGWTRRIWMNQGEVMWWPKGNTAVSKGIGSTGDNNIYFASSPTDTGSAPTYHFIFDMSNGNFTASGNVTAYSDIRLKKDWATLPEDFIEQLATVKNGTYTRTDTQERQIGVSAQDLQLVAPEGVNDESEYLSVAYGNVALAAVVELSKRVLALEAELKALQGVK